MPMRTTAASPWPIGDRHADQRPSARRWGGRIVVVAVLAAALVAALAAPAAAHAELIRSDPAPGAVLQRSPAEIVLTFTESVEAQGGAIRVFDTDGERVDQGGADASGSTVRMPLPDLGDGSYVVTWRVTSADAHPISGAFTFQVGQGAGAGATSREVQGLADELLAEQGGDRVVGAVYGVARFLVFAGLALLIGAVFFSLVIWPPARATAGARRVALTGWIATFVGTAVGLLAYGPYAEGLGLGDVLSTTLLGNTLDVRFGQVWLARLLLLLVAAPLCWMLFARTDDGAPRPLPAWWLPPAAVIAVALAGTPALAGHAVSGDWVTAAVIADVIHVLAMSLWLGGLTVLAVVGLSRRAPVEARDALDPFSLLALWCVIALVATGAFQTWRQVGSFDALRSTDYGRILVIKLVLVALVIVFAAFSREVVLRLVLPRQRDRGVPVVAGGADDLVDQDDDAAAYEVDEGYEVRQLRRSVWAEIATAGLIVIATALLVNAPPAKTAEASGSDGGVAAVTLEGDQVSVDVTVTPAVAGENDVHVDVANPSGAPMDVDELTVRFALPDKGIAPIDVPLRRLGPGHYYSPGFQIPLAGDWRVTAKPLVSEFEQPTLRGAIEVG